MKIREAEVNDAAAMLELFKKLDSETSFMLMEPGERKTSLEEQQKQIESFANTASKLMAVAEIQGHVAGFIVAVGGFAQRNQHSAYMVIGVEKRYWRQGIAGAMIGFMEDWAKNHGIHRIELTVVEENLAARALYRRCQYVEEGLKRDALKIGGRFFNEIYMAKLI
ncbi:GNAT family protein [Teredinibacter sp. KSP-S5-2]|uniref:GNAT family N-acetyltransferase n=1 Tax=Teredinibacter sp. KSP-S5-2 TaxID=3034506 RepID=UPI00293455F1|nr:GNAT family protein [Teredinibacter sp. KSP-S5-2]WNO11038.1 GNAT family protein [Teredinibacter sp. KSP-S5-2]